MSHINRDRFLACTRIYLRYDLKQFAGSELNFTGLSNGY